MSDTGSPSSPEHTVQAMRRAVDRGEVEAAIELGVNRLRDLETRLVLRNSSARLALSGRVSGLIVRTMSSNPASRANTATGKSATCVNLAHAL